MKHASITDPSRRQFAKKLAVLFGSPLAAQAGAAVALSAARPEGAPEGPTPTPASSQASPSSELPSPLAEALAEVARLRFGKSLSADQLRDLTRSLDRSVKSAEKLKQVKLTNGDEPEFTFTARIR